jgi:L-lactate dehydrogenase complex protein LldF
VHEALEDRRLQGAVRAATERLSSAYGRVAAETSDFDDLRRRAAEIRRRTLLQLDRHLETLADNVERNGGHVYFAADAAAARAYVLALAHRHGVRRVVKSKSMISEEIELNHALEASGVEAVETDLGEYIVQQAGEVPSHIIIPALHKTVEQVSGLFSSIVGRDLPPDPPQLAAMARAVLRDRFLTADMGVSGVNFAVAESGTLAIVSNEGNVDMCTTLPRVHVALMGMERLVPSWDELPPLLRILPMAGTGQRITTYVTFLSGPRRPQEPDGPDETHLVILDNGRASILGTEFADVLRCIRCGACLNVCPIYRNIGGHAYGAVYPGPVGAVLSPLLMGDAAADLPYASSLCGACSEACPVGIPLHDLLIKHRQRYVSEGKSPPAERLAFHLLAQTWSRPGTFRFANEVGSRVLRVLGGLPGGDSAWIGRLPGPGAGWTDERDFPAPRGEPFHRRWSRLAREATEPEGTNADRGPRPTSSHHVDPEGTSPPRPRGEPATPLHTDPGLPDLLPTASDGRAAFLARVHAHLSRGAAHAGPAMPGGPLWGSASPAPRSLLPRFVEEITRVVGSAEAVSTPAAAMAAVVELLAGAGATSAVLSEDIPLDLGQLSAALEARDIAAIRYDARPQGHDPGPSPDARGPLWGTTQGGGPSGDSPRQVQDAPTPDDPTKGGTTHGWREATAQAMAGVTGAAYGIADTGTVVLMAGRLPALLPPIHVVVLEASCLLPDLATVCSLLGERGRAFTLPSGVVLATGPSRSSDIGGNIVRGVHGPGRVHVIFLDPSN